MGTKYRLLALTGLFTTLLLSLFFGTLYFPVQAETAFAHINAITTVITRTVVLTPTKDNTLYEDSNGATSNGVGSFFFVGKTKDGAIRRGLLAFDVAGQLPSGATVISTSLQLQMSKSNAGPTTVGLHRLLTDWGEGASDASSNEGGGANATTDDATWLHTHFDGTRWQTPGGDFVITTTAAISVSDVGHYQWPSSPLMIAEVQQWLDSAENNFGWIVIGEESRDRTAKRFTARESGSAADRPQLTIVYTVAGTITDTPPSGLYIPLIYNNPQ